LGSSAATLYPFLPSSASSSTHHSISAPIYIVTPKRRSLQVRAFGAGGRTTDRRILWLEAGQLGLLPPPPSAWQLTAAPAGRRRPQATDLSKFAEHGEEEAARLR
jgi:hypothetical protein